MYTTSSIDQSYKNECTVFYKASALLPNGILKGYGDYCVTFYKLSKDTPNICNPIGESAYGLFIGEFVRDHPYEVSDKVTRDRFNDTFFSCQCHVNSYARIDQYESISIDSFADLITTLGLQYVPQDAQGNSVAANPPGFRKLHNWHRIENCGNFQTITAESDKHYYCFEYITT